VARSRVSPFIYEQAFIVNIRAFSTAILVDGDHSVRDGSYNKNGYRINMTIIGIEPGIHTWSDEPTGMVAVGKSRNEGG